MDPWEVIKNYRNRLYAIRTVLGWSVNGLLNGHSDTMEAEFPSAMVNRITVCKLEEMLTVQYYHDFGDKKRHEVFGNCLLFCKAGGQTLQPKNAFQGRAAPAGSLDPWTWILGTN